MCALALPTRSRPRVASSAVTPRAFFIFFPLGRARVARPRARAFRTLARRAAVSMSKPLPRALVERLSKRGIAVPSDEREASDASDGSDAIERAGANAREARVTSETEASTSDLPPGWKSKVDATYGRVYYYNKALNKTQWERPESSERAAPPPPPRVKPAVVAPLPPGWQATIDPASGREYYFNPHTHKTSWERPKDAASAVGMKRCSGCGGFGRGLVKEHGYCMHCSRVLEMYPPGVNSLDVVENKFVTKRERSAPPPPPVVAEKKVAEASIAKQASVRHEIGPTTHTHAESVPAAKKRAVLPPRASKVKDEEPLDPMDPAAYSDAPRGTWGTGIEKSRAGQ